LTSLLLVACERPLQTNSTAEEAYPAATDAATTGETTDDVVAEEAADAAADTDEVTSDEELPPAEEGEVVVEEDAATEGDADAEGDAAVDEELPPAEETTEGATEEVAEGTETDSDDMASGEAGDEAPADTGDAAAGDDAAATEETEPTDEEAAGLEGIAHTVAEGETIFDVAALYGASWVIVAEYNGITDVSSLEVGSTIYIPDEETAAALRDEMAAQLAEAGVGEATEEGAADTAAEGEEAEAAEAGTGGEAAEAGTTTETIYVVKRGDNLYRIGLMFGISWVQIAEANGIMNPNDIKAGQELKIPVSAPGPAPEFTHTVQRGETLFKISLIYGVPWPDIARANQLRPPYTIYPGQTLIIPGHGNG
jgi:LysM repeat protein